MLAAKWNMNNCFVCKHDIPETGTQANGITLIDCPVCSKFEVSEQILLNREGIEDDKLHIYSGALREHEQRGESPYYFRDVPTLLASVRVPANTFDKLDKLLLAIDARSSYFGQELHVRIQTDYSLAYSQNENEFQNLLQMAGKIGYVSRHPRVGGHDRIALDTDGLNRLIDLQKTQIRSDQAFVAMNFDGSMEKVYETGIAPALEATGFKPMLISRKDHDNKIDDEIIAEINRSGLLIADFTGQRQNVYYEAGYAKGLGIRVIFCCRENQIKEAHFDVRQYYHVTWNTPEELKEKLTRRIQAGLPTRIAVSA
jgi:hypothetical protein